jgi:hypothetical protein
MNYLTNDILLLQQLSVLNLVSIDAPVLSYDPLKKQIIYTFVGRNSIFEEYVIELRIKRFDYCQLEGINVYSPQANLPQPVVLTELGGIAIAGASFEGTIITTLESSVPPPPVLIPPIATPTVSTLLGLTTFNLSLPPNVIPQNIPNTTFLL